MKKFATFYNTAYHYDSKTLEITQLHDCKQASLGSDSYLELDARKSLHNLIDDVNKHVERMKSVKKFIGYSIHDGDFFTANNRMIYDSRPDLKIV